MGLGAIFVIAEQRGGLPTGHSLELCSGARALGAEVTAFVWGEGAAGAASVLGRYGASAVFYLPDLGDALPAPLIAASVAGKIGQSDGPPDAIFCPASYDGRDIAARLSARLDRPLISNVSGLALEPKGLVSEHMVFGGSEVARARFTGDPPWIFLLRPKCFEPAEGAHGAVAPVVMELEVPRLGTAAEATVVARHDEKRSGPSFDAAKVVVAAGRGLGSADRYALIEELAQLLGGAPAASRAIVDAGWVPYAYQVGQTGRTVSPDVYLAFGISGATQHLVGMKGAKHVVAVNNDPGAPMVQIADLGVVGDVAQVLPKLVDAVRARAVSAG